MNLDAVRAHLRAAQDQITSGDAATAVATLDRAIDDLSPDRLLTPGEAAEILGVRLELPVLWWCQSGVLTCRQIGERVMVPLSEAERLRDSDHVRAIQRSDRLHELSAEFGDDEGLSQEEMDDLEASRPGTLPWNRPSRNGTSDRAT